MGVRQVNNDVGQEGKSSVNEDSSSVRRGNWEPVIWGKELDVELGVVCIDVEKKYTYRQ